uniref:ATP synthase F0 subunit 6 n=1 Tax=Euurobracon yokahamae TaxID=2911681 RepID=UPI002079CA75|nr:ATP synthase F0 subunit 6 [Euurobracon yokahamae]UJJ81887.1 ATP synthase F0 subunit 6 [Euurobracon yokahamae]
MFDPQTKLFFSVNWISTFLILFIIPQIFWLMKSRLFYLINFFFLNLWLEFKIILIYKFNLNNLIYFIVLFMFILMNNFMGLFSYIFTSSSHLIYSMIFSLSMWMSLMMFGWLQNLNFMLIHLVPKGTPFILMFFMVLIELLSNLIRPLTLCVRLTANMIAGHLLMTLLSQFISNIFLMYLFSLFMQILLFLLELGVSVIQSYVFVILMILYMKETN